MSVIGDSMKGVGDKACDGSGNGNDGTLNKGNIGDGLNWPEGVRGKALEFDGDDDYVAIPHSSSLDPTFAITIRDDHPRASLLR